MAHHGSCTGAYFDYHPDMQESVSVDAMIRTHLNLIIKKVVDVVDNTHPSTKMLPAHWRLLDEM